MKLRKDDEVMVITGKYKGQTGKVLSVHPATSKVLVENINVVKRHTKPSTKNPRGGILPITKPIDVSKLMVLDPVTKQPARIGYVIKADGSKERIFKVSPNREAKKPTTKKTEAKTEDKVEKKASVKKPVAKQTEEKK